MTAINATGGTNVALARQRRHGEQQRERLLPSTAAAALGAHPAPGWWPDGARSRENAKNVRAVTQAMPQKSWPTTAIVMIASAWFWFISACEDRDRAAGGLVDGTDVGRGERDRQQHEPADHRRDGHRLPDALRRRLLSLVRLLGDVAEAS